MRFFAFAAIAAAALAAPMGHAQSEQGSAPSHKLRYRCPDIVVAAPSCSAASTTVWQLDDLPTSGSSMPPDGDPATAGRGAMERRDGLPSQLDQTQRQLDQQ